VFLVFQASLIKVSDSINCYIMVLGYLDIILIVLFFQLIVLVPFLLFQKTGKGLPNRLLGIFLLAKALCITNFLSFRLYDHTFTHFPHAFYFGSSFTILWGPMLYLYIRSLTQKDLQFRYRDILHVMPFLVHFLILSFTYHIHNADAKREILRNGGLFSSGVWYYFYTFLHVYILGYTIAALVRIRNYHKAIKNSYSSVRSIHLSWMYFILVGFLLKWSCDVCFHIAGNSGTFASGALLTSRASLFLFITIMIYKGLKHPCLLLGDTYDSQLRKQSLSAVSKETYLQKLLGFMEREKPYLDPDLTLEQLAKRVSIPSRSLTTVLNEYLNRNFYDFINSYRVKESTGILLEKSPRYKTVLEVLYEVGFNNKSSFNIAFKKHNGMTPTEYRKLQTPQFH